MSKGKNFTVAIIKIVNMHGVIWINEVNKASTPVSTFGKKSCTHSVCFGLNMWITCSIVVSVQIR